jgi:hypothetical protein
VLSQAPAKQLPDRANPSFSKSRANAGRGSSLQVSRAQKRIHETQSNDPAVAIVEKSGRRAQRSLNVGFVGIRRTIYAFQILQPVRAGRFKGRSGNAGSSAGHIALVAYSRPPHRGRRERGPASGSEGGLLPARILKTLPFLTRLTARLVGIGVRAEHVESPEFQPEAVEAH